MGFGRSSLSPMGTRTGVVACTMVFFNGAGGIHGNIISIAIGEEGDDAERCFTVGGGMEWGFEL